jgi:SAM-dependent methyltransferase
MIEQNHGNWQKYQNRNPIQKALIGRFLAQVQSLVIPLSGHSILDAGCGEAFVLNALLEVRPDLEVAIGADIDCEALRRGHEISPHIQLVRTDILHLPYAANTFDIVLCTEVLEHIPTPEIALAEICRVSNRYCVLSVPHEPFFRLGNLIRGKNIARFGNDIDHHQAWSHAGFIRFLNDHLQILAVKRTFPWQIVVGQIR